MEGHRGRVVEPVLDTLRRYPDGATLSDIQAAAAAAAGALDGAHATVRDCLLTFDADLEHAQFALPDAERRALVVRLRERLERVVGTH
jgi:hypothetical protein